LQPLQVSLRDREALLDLMSQRLTVKLLLLELLEVNLKGLDTR
jgi:hypothetical protein